MLVTKMQILCDHPGCDQHFPTMGAADGETYNSADVRAMARGHQWVRVKGKDYCPDHAGFSGAKVEPTA
jgi:hypothetical protein